MLDGVAQMWGYRGLIGHLTQRELKAKYKKSVLGWAWSLLNPAATLLIYTIVFGAFLRIQPPIAGNGHTKSFALYLFAALIIWNYFNATIGGGMSSLLGNGPLLKKVYFPAECIVIATTLATLLQAAVESIILSAVMVIVGNAAPTFLFFPVILSLLVLFCLGVALVAGLINAYFRDVGYIVAIRDEPVLLRDAYHLPAKDHPEGIGWSSSSDHHFPQPIGKVRAGFA